MNIFRRIISILGIAAFIIAAVYGFLYINARSLSDLNPGKAVPDSFVLCLKSNDLINLEDKIRNKSEIWEGFKSIDDYEDFQNFEDLLIEFDSICNSNKEFEALFKREAYLSIHKTSAKLDFLLSMASAEINATEEFMKVLNAESKISKFKYENQTCYHLEPNGRIIFKEIFFYEYRGILALSGSRALIEESIRQLNSGEDIFMSPRFKRIAETAGEDVPANIFINYLELSKLSAEIFKENQNISLNELFTSSVLDMEIYENKLVLNGFTSIENSSSSPFLNFKNPIPGNSLRHLFPADIAYFKEFRGYSYHNYSGNEKEKAFLRRFMELGNNNFASLITKSGGIYYSFMYVDLLSGGNMWDFLTKEAKDVLDENYTIEIKEISTGNKLISVAIFETVPAPLEATILKGKDFRCFTIYENALIFAESLDDLSDIVLQNDLGNTLSNDEYFMGLEDNFASNSNVFSYINPSEYFGMFLQNLNEVAREIFLKGKGIWTKFGVLSFQSTRADDLHYFRIYIDFSGGKREVVNTTWKRNLDTLAFCKPVIVTNHTNGAKEIFIQDVNRNVYLISSSGKVLWKTKTDGSILSEVFQVDYYNNGKLQYLFNTKKRLYLIDRNGNSVEKFPIEFRSEASAGIRIYDYDNSGEWRISVALSDKDIVVYDMEGSVVPGWRFRNADHIINQSVEYARIGTKDFIIARDDYQVYFLDRKGKKRIKPNRQIHFSENNPVYIDRAAGNGKERVIASDNMGSVYYFYFDERVEKILDNDLSADHYFIAEDIVGDREKEFIFTDNERLLVYDQKGNIVLRYVMPEKISLRPVVYEFSSDNKKIGLVATKTGKIYLLNKDGTLYDGFPLKGSYLFSISSFPGLKDRFNLIVSHKDNFLYNYSVK